MADSLFAQKIKARESEFALKLSYIQEDLEKVQE